MVAITVLSHLSSLNQTWLASSDSFPVHFCHESQSSPSKCSQMGYQYTWCGNDMQPVWTWKPLHVHALLCPLARTSPHLMRSDFGSNLRWSLSNPSTARAVCTYLSRTMTLKGGKPYLVENSSPQPFPEERHHVTALLFWSLRKSTKITDPQLACIKSSPSLKASVIFYTFHLLSPDSDWQGPCISFQRRSDLAPWCEEWSNQIPH